MILVHDLGTRDRLAREPDKRRSRPPLPPSSLPKDELPQDETATLMQPMEDRYNCGG